MKIDITRNENNKSSNVPIIFIIAENCAVFRFFFNSIVGCFWKTGCSLVNAISTAMIYQCTASQARTWNARTAHAWIQSYVNASIFYSIIAIAFDCLSIFIVVLVLFHSMYRTTNDVWFQLKHARKVYMFIWKQTNDWNEAKWTKKLYHNNNS